MTMNNRIRELAEQATETFTTYFDGRGNVTETYFDKEKFARLIVQECAGLFPAEYDTVEGKTTISKIIKQHFGVAE